MRIAVVVFLALIPACGGCNDPGGGGADANACGPNMIVCESGQVCRYDNCVAVPAPCAVDAECTGDTYCDESLGECLPWGVGPGGIMDNACVRDPVPGVFFPNAQCEWLGPPPSDPYPMHRNVLSAPMVAVFDNQDEFVRPWIVAVSYNYTDGGDPACQSIDPLYFGVIRVLDGRTCEQIYTIDAPTVVGSTSVALADIGGVDSTPEIIAARSIGGLVAFTLHPVDGWVVLWETASTYADTMCNWTGPSVHDLDDDGVPEILLYGTVYDAAGNLLDETIAQSALDPYANGYIPVVADMDGDGDVELVSGNQLYGWDRINTQWVAEGPVIGQSGRTAVADLGTFGADPGLDDRATLDGIAEIVTVHAGVIHAFAIAGREIFTANLQGAPPGNGGPPTIADFDGDGRAELAAAGATAYTVFDLDCRGAPDPATCPGLRTDGVLWTQPSQDQSSNVTGSSVFDFDGDDRAEVVYGDECYTRVYDGVTGQVLYSRYRTSCTWHENPLIVDVDGDFNAEIVSTSNTNCSVGCPALDPIFDGVQCLDDSDCPGATPCGREQPGDPLGRCRCTADADCGGDGFVCRAPVAGTGMVCRAEHPGPATAFGVRVLSDQLDRWVNTRVIWNQHAYSVTNVDENGQVPRTSNWLRNWTVPGLNNFRQNTPGSGLGSSGSPDLTVRQVKAQCAGEDAILSIEVCNRGTEPVGDGVSIAAYAVGPPPVLACTATTMANLYPGVCQTVTCTWVGAGGDVRVVVDDDGTGSGQNLECRETNNDAVLAGVACP